jgi:iron complex transport system permease protein
VLAGAGVLVLAGMLTSVLVGAVRVSPADVLGITAHRLLPWVDAGGWSAVQERIVWDYRLPRAVLALLTGAGLATVGAVLQAVVRNPLADPFLLGASSGASFGAVLVLVSGSAVAGTLGLSAAAFAGSLLAMLLVYLAARISGRLTAGRLVLAGVALAYLFQAGYSFLLQKADAARAAQAALFWLLGSLAGARWDELPLPAVALVAGLALLVAQWRVLNAVAAGEDVAVSLGVPVHRLRAQMFVVTSVLTGVMVALTGAIAFVGLIVPHAARLLVGADHRRLLPMAALLGAGFLQVVDIAARLLDAPQELPLSVVTAVLGVPFFLWLLRRRDGGRMAG